MTATDDLRAAVERDVEAKLFRARRDTIRAIANGAPEDGGALKGSVKVDPPRRAGNVYQLAASAGEGLRDDRARYTEEGTGVYAGRGRIYPRQAKTLRFFWKRGPQGAKVYYFRSVAGQPAQRWFSKPMPARWAAALKKAFR